MADIEAVLADVSYLLALDKNSQAKRVSKKITLPDLFSTGAVETKLSKPTNNFSIDYILSQKLGTSLMGRFVSEDIDTAMVPLVNFYSKILNYNNQTLSVAQYAILCDMDKILNTDVDPNNKYLNVPLSSEEYIDKLVYFEKFIEEKVTRKISQYSSNENLRYNDKLTKSEHNLNINYNVGSKDELNIKTRSITKINEDAFLSDVQEENNPSQENNNNNTPVISQDPSVSSPIHEDASTMHLIGSNDLDSRRRIELLLNMDDFNIHRKIGRGGFGEVYGCHKMDTGKLFAMKILDKKRLKNKHCIRSALLEQKILAMCDCPFIVRMCYCFQSNSKLVILLELLDGGDLRYHANNVTTFNEEQVRFFSSEIYLGLEYLHKKSIIFRDLKPANILLETSGHVKISDFGLAFVYDELKPPKSFAGTYGYMAPEIIKKEAYGFGVDWFSFGCLIYKLFKGNSPFHNSKDCSEKIIDNTLNKVPECSGMPDDMRNLVENLLTKDQFHRIGGNTKMAYESVKKSNWFKKIDWVSFYLRKVEPPFVPPQGEINAENIYTIGNFDDAESKKVKITERDNEKFNRFNFFSESVWEEELIDSVFQNVVSEALKHTKNYILFRLYRKSLEPNLIIYGYLWKQFNLIFTFNQKKFVQIFNDKITIGTAPLIVKTTIKRGEIVSIQRSKNNGIQLIMAEKKSIVFKTENPAEDHVWFMCFEKFITNKSTMEMNAIGLKTGVVDSRVELPSKLSDSDT